MAWDIYFGPFKYVKLNGRKSPKRFVEFRNIAKRAGLSNPAGRALYACNRFANGWPWKFHKTAKDQIGQFTIPSPLTQMKSCRPSTAKTWSTHWKKGGHIKALLPSKEFNRRRRIADKERKEDREFYRRKFELKQILEKSEKSEIYGDKDGNIIEVKSEIYRDKDGNIIEVKN